jgi:chromate transport protein ChrA
LTITDLIGKIFTFCCMLLGMYVGNIFIGVKGAMAGLIIGYLGGSLLFYILLYLTVLYSDIKQRKKTTDSQKKAAS